MDHIVVARHGGPERMKLVRSAPDPAASPGQVRVRFAGVNFADIMMRMGLYPGGPRPPFTPGLEVAGETDDGRRVMAMTNSGGYATHIVVPQRQAAPVPEAVISDE